MTEDFKKYKLIQDVKTGVKLLVSIQGSVNILTRVKARVSELANKIAEANTEKVNATVKYNKLIKERDDLQEKIDEVEAQHGQFIQISP